MQTVSRPTTPVISDSAFFAILVQFVLYASLILVLAGVSVFTPSPMSKPEVAQRNHASVAPGTLAGVR